MSRIDHPTTFSYTDYYEFLPSGRIRNIKIYAENTLIAKLTLDPRKWRGLEQEIIYALIQRDWLPGSVLDENGLCPPERMSEQGITLERMNKSPL